MFQQAIHVDNFRLSTEILASETFKTKFVDKEVKKKQGESNSTVLSQILSTTIVTIVVIILF